MTNIDSILKSKDITLPTKVHLVKTTGFPVIMYGCESQIIKKAECQRIDTFKLWCQKRLLRVPWTERRSNQSILKEINPKQSLEGLGLKLQCFGHLIRRADSLEKSQLMLEKIEGKRRRSQQRMRQLDDSMDMNLSKLGDSGEKRSAVCCNPGGCKQLDTTQGLNNISTLFFFFKQMFINQFVLVHIFRE